MAHRPHRILGLCCGLLLLPGPALAEDELTALFDEPAETPSPARPEESTPASDSIVLQASPTPGPRPARQSRLVEEIVVTAQKREEAV